ncbi:hypothetical protein GALMADRAFT_249087 [Galerina marginata CBS 339.88]|uniref:RanBD1 domain-containing protein n=1 Tax=Galerina marginata (strain CBS 339.88) TaxID=685588 RepID=A0A067SYJ8_GALM3|nr:hypothetical protein GALMADRAFT_249087 [Galerina marginata CBS 339.88]
MKRQAERQLVKGDDEVDDEDSNSQGFKKAEESVLATRVIRGLPKRTGTAPQIPTSNTTTPVVPAPIFATNAFTGGSSSSPSTGLIFDKQFAMDTTGNSSSASASSPFGTTSSTKSVFSPTFQNPLAMPPTATNTSKAFAASISNSGANPFGVSPSNSVVNPFAPLPSAAQPSSSSTTSNNSDDSAPLLKYYTDLRGLNMSFLGAISKAVEGDPFIDMSTFLKKYESIRQKIQEDFDNSVKSTSTAEPASTSSSSTSKPAMPTPPASFSGFNSFLPSAATPSPTPPKTNLFDFKTSSSGFGSSSAANPFAPKDSSNNSFGASSPMTADNASATTSHTPFIFGGTKPSTSSTFGSFGSPSSSTSFGSTSGQPVKSVFGSGSGTTTPTLFGSSTSDKPSSSNIFGSSDKTSTTTFASAFSLPAATKDSAKSPVHFPFGSSITPSVFGALKPSTELSAGSTGEHSPDGGSSERATPAAEGAEATSDSAEPPHILSSHNPHDDEGEGEENEETIHNVKSKVYRLSKAEDGSVKWVVLGSGILRLKKDKDTGARRMLARNSTNGKVIINFALYSGLKPISQGKNALNFVGHDAGNSQTYSVRVANEDDAGQLKSILEREIAFVKAKED